MTAAAVAEIVNNMKKHYVYTLSCPVFNNVRYIGITSDLKKRYSGHMNSVEKTHKYNWIISLKKKGLKPLMEELDFALCADDVKYLEKFYISLFKSWGFSLVNQTEGGEGTFGYKYDKEKIKSMVNRRKESGSYKSSIEKLIKSNIETGVYERHRERMVSNNPMKNPSTARLVSLSNKESGVLEKNRNRMKVNNPMFNKDTASMVTLLNLKHRRKYLQYDKFGNFIKEFNCLSDIKKEFNINGTGVQAVCRGEKISCAGYVWRVKQEDGCVAKIKVRRKITHTSVPIVQYDLNGNLIKEWDKMIDAQLLMSGNTYGSISHACRGIQNSAYGFVWKYKINNI